MNLKIDDLEKNDKKKITNDTEHSENTSKCPETSLSGISIESSNLIQ